MEDTQTQVPTRSTRITISAPDDLAREFQILVPEGFEGEPTSALDILRRAYAALRLEGMWCTSIWFMNRHPELNPEDAFCNNWHACADGFLVAVSIGAHRWKPPAVDQPTRWGMDEHWGRDIVQANMLSDARGFMIQAGTRMFRGTSSSAGVVGINDSACASRAQAEEWFQAAIALAEREDKS